MARFLESSPERTEAEEYADILRSAGLDSFATGVADALVFASHNVATAPLSDTWLEHLTERLSPHQGEPAAVVYLLFLTRLFDNHRQIAPQVAARSSAWLGAGELNDNLRRVEALAPGTTRVLANLGVLTALVNNGTIEPRSFISGERIRTLPGPALPYRLDDRRVTEDIQLPRFWTEVDATATALALAVLIDEESPEQLAALCSGLIRALGTRTDPWSTALEQSLAPPAIRLWNRWQSNPCDDPRVLECCWRFGLRVPIGALREAAGPAWENLRNQLSNKALEFLGRLRSELKKPEDEARASLESNYILMDVAAALAIHLHDKDPLWSVVRRLLLAFHDLGHQAVPLDLRTWDELGGGFEPMPMPWGSIPTMIGGVLEAHLGQQLKADPELLEFRQQFAAFALERLKTKKRKDPDHAIADSDMVEPDPDWRQGWLLAAAELDVNPRGSAHKIAKWSASRDPDDEVRATATNVAQRLRRGVERSNASPRRLVYSAFRRIREAHLLALGFTPDPAGVERTVRKEARRTRELDALQPKT